MTKHVHADVIHAFADGKQIQWFNSLKNKWNDWILPIAPAFYAEEKYRIKPPSLTYRVALFKFGTSGWLSTAYGDRERRSLETSPNFVSWVTDEISVEV